MNSHGVKNILVLFLVFFVISIFFKETNILSEHLGMIRTQILVQWSRIFLCTILDYFSFYNMVILFAKDQRENPFVLLLFSTKDWIIPPIYGSFKSALFGFINLRGKYFILRSVFTIFKVRCVEF
jgi:hypothetical protein